MSVPFVSSLLLVACISLADAVPYHRMPYRSNYGVMNGYMRRLSTRYLDLIKSYLTRKLHFSAKRSLNGEENMMVGRSEYRKRGYVNNGFMNGYLKKISSDYLRFIKNFLARHPQKTSKREAIENENSWEYVINHKKSVM